MQQRSKLTVDISEDADKTSPLDMAEQVQNILVFPNTTSTTFGFQILNAEFNIGDPPALTDTRWTTVFDTAGAELSYSIPTSGGAVSLDWSAVFGSRWVRLTLGTNEAADREIFVFTQQIG